MNAAMEAFPEDAQELFEIGESGGIWSDSQAMREMDILESTGELSPEVREAERCI